MSNSRVDVNMGWFAGDVYPNCQSIRDGCQKIPFVELIQKEQGRGGRSWTRRRLLYKT
jgi:hypothetical protein